MPQSVANYQEVMKEVWTQERLERQFYSKTPLLDRLERTNRYTIGEVAKVPLEKSLPGAGSVFGAAGGTLNTADEVGVDTADYTLSYPWQPLQITFGALNQATGGSKSVGAALRTEIDAAVTAIRRDVMRMVVANGDALIAQCDDGGASTTVELLATGYGYDAIRRGHLRVGLVVDIGTTADEGSIATDRTITAVKKSSSDPDITISGAAVTTVAATGHYVSVANARSGATSNEMNGLRLLAGSASLPVGGLDPDTAGEEFWQPAQVDTTTTVLSLDLVLQLQESVFMETGEWPTDFFTSAKQARNYDQLLFNQMRYDSNSFDAGHVEKNKLHGNTVTPVVDIYDREFYALTVSDFLIVTGAYDKPTFVSEVEGFNKGLSWDGNTNFKDAVVYPLQLAIRRRNSHAAAIALTA